MREVTFDGRRVRISASLRTLMVYEDEFGQDVFSVIGPAFERGRQMDGGRFAFSLGDLPLAGVVRLARREREPRGLVLRRGRGGRAGFFTRRPHGGAGRGGAGRHDRVLDEWTGATVLHRARALGLTDRDLDEMRMDEFLTVCDVHIALAGARRDGAAGTPKESGREVTLDELANMG